VPLLSPSFLIAWTNSIGVYTHPVSPGTYSEAAMVAGGYSLINLDHATMIWTPGIWTGTVGSGESRQVDFILKINEKANATIAGQVRMHGTGAPFAGFVVTASTGTPLPPVTTNALGLFVFSPVAGTGWTWTVDGSAPGYAVVHVEYRAITVATPTVASTLPVSFLLPASTFEWVDIQLNASTPLMGTVFGKVYRLHGDVPAAGATVTITPSGGTTPIGTQVVGPDALYTFTVPAGTYSVMATLAHYHAASATVVVVAGSTVYQPLYLVPSIIIGPDIAVNLTFVHAGNLTPAANMRVDIDGVGNFVTDSHGKIQVPIYFEGNFTLLCGSTSVPSATGDQKFASSPGGVVHLVPGQDRTIVLYAEKKAGETKGGASAAVVGAVAAGGIAAGAAVGLLLRRRP
jgi:hypothetical protein